MNEHYWNSVAQTWGERGTQALWRRHSDRVNGDLLAKWIGGQSVARVLKTDAFDEAVGTGLCPSLAATARSVVAMDLSVEVLHLAKGTQAIPLAAADVLALPFRTGAFALVFSNSTLDHFESATDIERALREIHRVLGPGGQLVLTLDNPLNPAVALRNALPFYWLHKLRLVPYRVGATCGPRRLRSMLEGAGFEVGQVTALLHVPRALAIGAAALLERRASAELRERFLGWLLSFEKLSRSPFRFLTGYFIAVHASKADVGSRQRRQSE
jgi:SAM-dependent methyltransferase